MNRRSAAFLNLDPAVTALICTYNRAVLLPRVLEALCAQTLPKERFEVVLIDDGSTDETREIVASFESQIRLHYHHQANRGLAAAKNKGLELANAPIVVFMDDDDYASPELLEEHLKAHENYPQDRIAVLGYTDLDESIARDPLMHFITEVGCYLFSYPRIKRDGLLDYTYFWGGRSSCKRNYLTTCGNFNSVFRFGCEDIELGYRLSQQGLRVFFNPNARTTMFRRISFDQFISRLIRQGRSQYVFSTLHPCDEIRKWTEVNEAAISWREIESTYEQVIASARQLDSLVRLKSDMGLDPDERTERLLHAAYWKAFRAAKLKGVIEGSRPSSSRLSILSTGDPDTH